MVRTSNAVLEMMLEDATHEGHDGERAEAGNSEVDGSEPSGADESTAHPLHADAQQPATDDEEQQPGRN